MGDDSSRDKLSLFRYRMGKNSSGADTGLLGSWFETWTAEGSPLYGGPGTSSPKKFKN